MPLPNRVRPTRPENTELAAEMARLVAIALVRDTPLAALTDPHHTVAIDAETNFDMHDLLFELRNLIWFDKSALESTDLDARQSARQNVSLNESGQLCLRTMFRSALPVDPANPAPTGDTPVPDAHLPTNSPSIRTLTRAVSHVAPSEAFVRLATAELADLTGFADGASDTLSTSGRLFAMLRQTTERCHAASTRIACEDRPVVVAAKLSLMLSGLDNARSKAHDSLRTVAEELTQSTPDLINWMTRASKAGRSLDFCRTSLFLPLLHSGEAPVPARSLQDHLVVAGALTTLLKALFDTSAGTRLRMVGACGPSPDLPARLDRICETFALARLGSGAYYAIENHQDLRRGQEIAVLVLREALSADNRICRLEWTDFDGRLTTMTASPQATGTARVQLHRDGHLSKWPAPTRSSRLNAVI